MTMKNNNEFPFQSGCSLCYKSNDYNITGGKKKYSKSIKNRKNLKLGGNKDFTQLLANNYVKPKSNYSNYGLIPNTLGNKVNYKTGVKDRSFLEANDYAIIYNTTGGKKKSKQLNMKEKKKQKGGDSNYGATGLPLRFYNNEEPSKSCDFGINETRNVGITNLKMMEPKCMAGSGKNKKINKNKAINKKDLKKKIGSGCDFNVLQDSVSGPVSTVKGSIKNFENYVEGLEQKMLNFGKKMMSMNVPNYNPSQTGGTELKLTKDFDNYVQNLLSAMNKFKNDIVNINKINKTKSKSNLKSKSKSNQNGGLNLLQGKNLDLATAPTHPIWTNTEGGKKVNKKVVKKKITKKGIKKAEKTKKMIALENDTTVEVGTLYNKIMKLRAEKKNII